MKEKASSDFISVDQFMKELKGSLFANQFVSTEEADESMEDFFSDDGGGESDVLNLSTEGDLSGEDADDVEDSPGSVQGSEEDSFEPEDVDPADGYKTAAERAVSAQKVIDNALIGTGQTAKEFSKNSQGKDGRITFESIASALEKTDQYKPEKNKESDERGASDPSGVRSEIQKAIDASKASVQNAQKQYDAPADNDTRPSQEPKNFSTSVQPNQNAESIGGRSDYANQSVMMQEISVQTTNGVYSGTPDQILEAAGNIEAGADERDADAKMEVYDEELEEFVDVFPVIVQDSMSAASAVDREVSEQLRQAVANIVESFDPDDRNSQNSLDEAINDLGTTDDGTTDDAAVAA